MSDQPSEHVDEVDTRTVTRRYRRPPGGWWWGALAGVPLVLALLGSMGSDDGAPAASSSPTSPTTSTAPATPAGSDTVTPSSSLSSDAGAATPTDGTTVTSTATDSSSADATSTQTVGASDTQTASSSPTATVTVTATPTPSATSNAKASAIGCSTFTKDVANVLAANKITFSSGGSELTGTSQQTIAAVAGALKRCDTTAVVVTGYTDNTGAASKNKAVSAARAAAVRQELVKDGVSAGRIASVGAGSADPVASNSSESGRAANRRVEITAN